MSAENEKINDLLRMQNEAKHRALDLQSRSRFRNDQERREPAPAAPPQPGEAPKPQEAVSPEERERMFLLSLCLLLSGEGADEALLVALLYLLN